MPPKVTNKKNFTTEFHNLKVKYPNFHNVISFLPAKCGEEVSRRAHFGVNRKPIPTIPTAVK